MGCPDVPDPPGAEPSAFLFLASYWAFLAIVSGQSLLLCPTVYTGFSHPKHKFFSMHRAFLASHAGFEGLEEYPLPLFNRTSEEPAPSSCMTFPNTSFSKNRTLLSPQVFEVPRC